MHGEQFPITLKWEWCWSTDVHRQPNAHRWALTKGNGWWWWWYELGRKRKYDIETQNRGYSCPDAKKYPQWVAGGQHGETLKGAGLCLHSPAKHPLLAITFQSGEHWRGANLAFSWAIQRCWVFTSFLNFAGQFPLYLRTWGHPRHSPLSKSFPLRGAARIELVSGLCSLFLINGKRVNALAGTSPSPFLQHSTNTDQHPHPRVRRCPRHSGYRGVSGPCQEWRM